MPRPTALTPAVQDAVCRMIRLGSTYKAAAQVAGIGTTTLRRWLATGEAKAGRYRSFWLAVQAAEAEGIAANLAVIEGAAQKGDWRAAAWILEHRHPETYGRAVVRHEGAVAGAPPPVVVKFVDAPAGSLAEAEPEPAAFPAPAPEPEDA